VLSDTRPTRSVELTEPRFARPVVSRTFEGRDRFAPAAGWLASGVDLAALGPPLATLVRLDLPVPRRAGECLEGEVMRVDRFGNLVTNITRAAFDDFRGSADVHIEAGTHRVEHFVATYADTPPGAVCALFGSTEHLEVACNGESAHERLRLARGALVRICRVAT
jgi:S-adenosylmethionine hydrolase